MTGNLFNDKRTTKRIVYKVLIVLVLFEIGDFAIFHVLKAGMDRYYGLNKSAEILCIGYSHTVLGLDAERMERELGVSVVKYATAGANTLDRFWMLKHFLRNHSSVTTVVYDVDPWLFDTEGLSSASYTLFLPYINDPVMSAYLSQASNWQEYVTAKFIRTARFRDQTINIALRGLLDKIENKKHSQIRVQDYQRHLERDKSRGIRIDTESRQCFMSTMAFLAQHKITVVLLNLPTIDRLNEIDPTVRRKMTDIFSDVAKRNNYIYFIDYNEDLQHRHELFYDLRHLNAQGNEIVTGRLIKDLKIRFGY